MTIGPEFLGRIERRAMIIAALLAVGALLWPGTGETKGPHVAAGVLGGAILAAISYFGIRRGVDGLAGAISGGPSGRAGLVRALTMLVGRYALLALIAYVMISRLRLSPLGLLIGVSVIPLAAAIETIAVFAGLRKTVRGNHGKV